MGNICANFMPVEERFSSKTPICAERIKQERRGNFGTGESKGQRLSDYA